jgi:hypothetical protein
MTDEPATAVIVPPKQLLIKAGDGDTLICLVSTVAGVKLLVKEGAVAAIVNISVAGAATVRWPDAKLLVVFRYGPGKAFAEIIRTTENVQLAPAAKAPVLKLKPDELRSTDPTPQTSLIGKVVLITRPESMSRKKAFALLTFILLQHYWILNYTQAMNSLTCTFNVGM